jgi:hypothetical protein
VTYSDGQSLYLMDTCLAAASDQPGEPISTAHRLTAGQMVTSKSHGTVGTSAGRRTRTADWDGVELGSGTLQRDGHVSLCKILNLSLSPYK